MIIILVGKAGFIGSNFIFYMIDIYPDCRIICFDKPMYAGALLSLTAVMDNHNFRFAKSDICGGEAVRRLFESEKPDMAVNGAVNSNVDCFIGEPGDLFADQYCRYICLMDACRIYSLQRKVGLICLVYIMWLKK